MSVRSSINNFYDFFTDLVEAWLPPLPGLSSFKSEDPSLWLARFQECKSF